MKTNLVVLIALSMGLNVFGLLLPRRGQAAHKQIIDLRSDTLTKPTPAMSKAMAEAIVGDDVFCEDPTVNKLEERVAMMFQKESSLFFPTGTMSNLAATMSWCSSRGSEVILGDSSHIYLFEQSNIAQIAGVSPRVIANRNDGTMDLQAMEAGIRGDNVHFPVTEMIALENTHNACGGRILPYEYVEAVSSLASQANIPLHVDGARIWNAATASGTRLSQLAEPVTSLSVCLSKGLGAPVGSLLVGPAEFIARARRVRKALGGGMRQVGVLAAAGMKALDDFEAGMLETDHANAKRLAEELSYIPGLNVDPDTTDTNIIMVHLGYQTEDAASFAEKLKFFGVLALPFGPRTLRLVTHRDFQEECVDIVVHAFRDVAARAWSQSPSLMLAAAASSTSSAPSESNDDDDDNSADEQTPTTTTTTNSDDDAVDAAIVTADNVSRDVRGSGTYSIPASAAAGAAEAQSSSTDAQNSREELVVVAAAAGLGEIDESAAGRKKNTAKRQGNEELEAPAEETATAPAPLVIHYEEAQVRAMSVSDNGFCVFLQGTVSDRYITVLVTPEDPMSDGLDTEIAETSEAVTLLQLLQGIDVETYLKRDALAQEFGRDRKQYKTRLRRVRVEEIGGSDRKNFEAVLVGTLQPRAFSPTGTGNATTTGSTNPVSVETAVPVTSTPTPPPVVGGSGEDGGAGTGNSNSTTSSESGSSRTDNRAEVQPPTQSKAKPLVLPVLSIPINIKGSTATNNRIEGVMMSTTGRTADSGGAGKPPTSTAVSSSDKRTVEISTNKAFTAIALALRHNASIEVRSEYFEDEKMSFTMPSDEVATEFPHMKEVSEALPRLDAKGPNAAINRLQRRLKEATRRGKEEKALQCRQLIDLYASKVAAAATVQQNKQDRIIKPQQPQQQQPSTPSADAGTVSN